jgi:hypothetical protein
VTQITVARTPWAYLQVTDEGPGRRPSFKTRSLHPAGEGALFALIERRDLGEKSGNGRCPSAVSTISLKNPQLPVGAAAVARIEGFPDDATR